MQEQAYEASAHRLVKDVCDGYNAGLFAYGQVCDFVDVER